MALTILNHINSVHLLPPTQFFLFEHSYYLTLKTSKNTQPSCSKCPGLCAVHNMMWRWVS